MRILSRFFYRFRSAITGLFVTQEFAAKHPNETVAEKITRLRREHDEDDGA